jgi:MFS family permease
VTAAVPASYYFQAAAVREQYGLSDYTLKVFEALPYFFKAWPEGVGSGLVVRLVLLIAAAAGMAAGFLGSVRRNRRLRLTQVKEEVSPEARRVGTLFYTKRGLIMMFFWMLWGDFCFTLMERIFPVIMPLQLKALGASNTALLFLKMQLPAALSFALVPIISFKSDRFRSRWGRRIPFIFVTAPFLVLFLGLLGYSQEIGEWIHASSLPGTLHLSPYLLTLIVIGALIVAFQFFNLFVNSVFWYLFADVIPKAYYGRFTAMFSLVGNLAGFVFKTWIYGHILTHTSYIYWGAGLLYLVGFSLMCTQVKEGKYPPPEDVGVRKNRFEGAIIFFRECFGHPFFVCIFLFNALWTVSNLANDLKIFFFFNHLKLSLDQMGAIDGIMGILCLLLSYIYGYLIDRVNPLKTMLVSIFLLVPITMAGAFITGFNSYLMVAVVTSLSSQLFDSSTGPMMLNLLPLERYGQFSSANALFRHAVNTLGPFVAGPVFDYLTDGGKTFSNYRYVFYWQAGFMLPALVAFLFVFVYWVRHGGKHGYVPPDTVVRVKTEG